MFSYQAPLKHMNFLLQQVFAASAQWQQHPAFAELDSASAEAVLQQAASLVESRIQHISAIGDQQGAQLQGGNVTLPSDYRDTYRELAAGGWLGVNGELRHGGQALPKMLTVLIDEMFNSGDCALTLYLALSKGCALALSKHADVATRTIVLPKLYSGEWAGAMCLTEPQAGSDLSTLTTRAEPQPDGSYTLHGQKVFISGGDQDFTDNIVYLVLARLPDAPPGSQGLSLFLTSKFAFDQTGTLGARQPVHIESIEHKMGLQASSTCSMRFDGAHAVLVGQPNKGLATMFTMMNDERLAIGLQGIGLGERSYQIAANYAKQRMQGKRAHRSESEGDSIAIIQHADVRRMLLTQRAWNEGGRALAVYLGQQLDIVDAHTDASVREQAAQRAALLIPVAKAFFSDRGLETCILGQQVLGGYGYLRDYRQEQWVRDVRIAQIYEGTNGIQAQDFLNRKVLPNGGKWLREFIVEMEQEIIPMSPCFAKEEDAALEACSKLRELTLWLVKQCARDDDLSGASACAFLDCAGLTIYAWLWLKMMNAAQRDVAIITVGRFYLSRLLPQVHALERAIRSGAENLMEIPDELF